MTIRDVPDEMRAVLASRAARVGQSLQECVRAQPLVTLDRRLAHASGPACSFVVPD